MLKLKIQDIPNIKINSINAKLEDLQRLNFDYTHHKIKLARTRKNGTLYIYTK